MLNRGERGGNNATGLKEGGGIEMLTTVLPLRDARFIRLIYLPNNTLPLLNLLVESMDTKSSGYRTRILIFGMNVILLGNC